MKIGGRVIKTGLAIAISIFVATLLLPDSNGVLAGIAGIHATETSVRRSFDSFLNRILGNILGAIIALVIIQTVGVTPVTVGITVILSISLLNYFKLSDVMMLVNTTVIVIMIGSGGSPYLFALNRVLETSIGVIISFVVNSLIYPPKYDTRFYQGLEYLTSQTLIWIRASVRKNTDFGLIQKDITWAREQLDSINGIFDLMQGEMALPNKNKHSEMRRLVVYRQMTRTTRIAIDLLAAFHYNAQVFDEFPRKLRHEVRDRIEVLTSAHEQILLKFNGKVPPENVNFLQQSTKERLSYMEMFFDQAKDQMVLPDDEVDATGVILIMGAVYRYEEELNHLNVLTRVYMRQPEPDQETVEQIEINKL